MDGLRVLYNVGDGPQGIMQLGTPSGLVETPAYVAYGINEPIPRDAKTYTLACFEHCKGDMWKCWVSPGEAIAACDAYSRYVLENPGGSMPRRDRHTSFHLFNKLRGECKLREVTFPYAGVRGDGCPVAPNHGSAAAAGAGGDDEEDDAEWDGSSDTTSSVGSGTDSDGETSDIVSDASGDAEVFGMQTAYTRLDAAVCGAVVAPPTSGNASREKWLYAWNAFDRMQALFPTHSDEWVACHLACTNGVCGDMHRRYGKVYMETMTRPHSLDGDIP